MQGRNQLTMRIVSQSSTILLLTSFDHNYFSRSLSGNKHTQCTNQSSLNSHCSRGCGHWDGIRPAGTVKACDVWHVPRVSIGLLVLGCGIGGGRGWCTVFSQRSAPEQPSPSEHYFGSILGVDWSIYNLGTTGIYIIAKRVALTLHVHL